MLQRKNKKGFTLAELLIVVAIIAVLTAIAVPLFVGALNSAEKKVAEANCATIRGLAISQILLNEDATKIETIDGTTVKCYGYGEVDSNGTVKNVSYYIGNDEDFATATSTGTCKTWAIKEFPSESASGVTLLDDKSAAYKVESGTYKIIVKIEKSEAMATA